MSSFNPKQIIIAELKIILAKNIHAKQHDAAKDLGISHETLNNYLKELEGITFKILRRNIIRTLSCNKALNINN